MNAATEHQLTEYRKGWRVRLEKPKRKIGYIWWVQHHDYPIMCGWSLTKRAANRRGDRRIRREWKREAKFQHSVDNLSSRVWVQ